MGCGRLPEQPLARQVGEVGHDGQRSLGSKDRAVHDLAARVQLCTAKCLCRLWWPPCLLLGWCERQDHRRANTEEFGEVLGLRRVRHNWQVSTEQEAATGAD